MPYSHVSIFPGKVHFNIKYLVTSNLLVTNWIMILLVYQIKSDPIFLHLFPNVVIPECVAILLMNT